MVRLIWPATQALVLVGAWGLSTGNSWQSSLWNGGPPSGEPVEAPLGPCITADFNGDDITDLLCENYMALSSGTGW